MIVLEEEEEERIVGIDAEDEGSAAAVPVPSAVKYRPKFFRSVREFRLDASTFDDRRSITSDLTVGSVASLAPQRI